MEYLVEEKLISNNEDFTSLANFDAVKSTNILKAFIKHLRKRELKPLSVNAYVSPLFLFFDMNRTAIFKIEINRVREKNDLESSGHTPVTSIEIQDMITVSNHPRDIALVLFLSSTGMRPGGLNDPILCMKHLEYMADPNNPENKKYCYTVKIYDGSRQHYWGFLTPESTKALEEYFAWRKNTRQEIFTPDTPIFSNVSITEFMNMTVTSIYRVLTKIYIKSGLVRVKEGFRYDKAVTYMYRIRFNTILKLNNNLNSNIAEKLMAHKKGLDGTYLQPTREECFTEFVKAIPELTINPAERQSQKITELEKVKNEKNKLERKLAEHDKILANMVNKEIEKTEVTADEKTKQLMMQLLKENNLI